MTSAVQPHAPRLRFDPDDVHEYHWRTLAKSPSVGSGVVAGLIGSTLVDDLPPVAWGCRLAWHHLLAWVPILLIWGALLGIVRADGALPEAWPPLIIPLELAAMPAMLMFGSLLDHSAALRQRRRPLASSASL
jgi:hypothetical protein